MFQFALFHHFAQVYQWIRSVFASKVSTLKRWYKQLSCSSHAWNLCIYCVSITNWFSEYLFCTLFPCMVSVFIPENTSLLVDISLIFSNNSCLHNFFPKTPIMLKLLKQFQQKMTTMDTYSNGSNGNSIHNFYQK